VMSVNDLALYRTMVAIRLFEERVRDLSLAGQIPGFVHLSIGQEAVAAGVAAALEARDRITSTHRGHGHLIARGGATAEMLNRMMAEILGRRTGFCRGKGGSMHIIDASLGILGANGIVAAGIPIATGAALAAKLRGSGEVAVAFFGDGASAEGVFHESLNLAAAWKLPVIFVCENNLYAEFTPTADVNAVRDVAAHARAYGAAEAIVDGNDVRAVHAAARGAVARARAGGGPTLVEAKTYRWDGHLVGEQAFLGPEAYRRDAEVESWKARCPIARFERALVEEGVAAGDLERIRDEVARAVDGAAAFAKESPYPGAEEALADVFAPTGEKPCAS